MFGNGVVTSTRSVLAFAAKIEISVGATELHKISAVVDFLRSGEMLTWIIGFSTLAQERDPGKGECRHVKIFVDLCCFCKPHVWVGVTFSQRWLISLAAHSCFCGTCQLFNLFDRGCQHSVAQFPFAVYGDIGLCSC